MTAPLPWFRLYLRMIDDEKIRLLAFEDRWHFVALCCLKGDGLIDEPDSELKRRKIAVKLGVQVRELEEIARRIREVGLIDENLCPVAWDELQFKSDSSTERVRAYRAKHSGNVSVTAQDKETDTESDQQKNNRTPRDELLAVLDAERADAVIDHRKRLRKPLSAHAAKLLARRFSEWMDPNAAADEMIARGWQGFNVEWMASTAQGMTRPPPNGNKPPTVAELAMRRAAEGMP
ncbi:MAG TPA: hypothetical protein VFU31_11400 [Candidatus Binatia bacterium]|nr:hypothetical protein [Candidatus Binatia bacterium]